MNALQDKVAVVTGGGSGVGLAVAEAFRTEGAQVVIAGRDAGKLETAAKRTGAHPIAADISDAAQARRLIDDATAKFGRVDILVNNAGMNVKGRALRELTTDDWDALIRTNLNGAFYCLHAVLPQMFARKDGVIVNVASVAGKRAYPPSGAGYTAAKFGMGALGMCLSNEERESGVRVSTIFPGEIDTPILDQRPKPPTAEQRAMLLKPEDVARAVLFVASLPRHVSIPELIMKPTVHSFW